MVMNVFVDAIGWQRLNYLFLKFFLYFKATHIDPRTIFLGQYKIEDRIAISLYVFVENNTLWETEMWKRFVLNLCGFLLHRVMEYDLWLKMLYQLMLLVLKI